MARAPGMQSARRERMRFKRFVIDSGWGSQTLARRFSLWWGRNVVKMVPLEPGWTVLLARMLPPCLRTMSWVIQRPSPLPSSCFVVKKWSKILGSDSGEMPVPLSMRLTAVPGHWPLPHDFDLRILMVRQP